MRRSLPAFIALSSESAVPANNPLNRLLVVKIRLATVTAVVGGGVEALTPDPLDPVRVPSIRGQLRGWWRALGDEPDAQALFDAETRLWGGVDVQEDAQKKPTARKSLVTLGVQVDSPGRVVPAGWHTRLEDWRFRALPDWNDGLWIGYGLFPLQRTNEERLQAFKGREGRLGTKSIREDLQFTLTLRVQPPGCDSPKGDALPASTPDLGRVLAALWAWVHFGGLGARTTRGFGALRVDSVEVIGDDGLNRTWLPLFTPCPVGNIEARLKKIRDFAKARAGKEAPDWPLLHGARFMVGRPERSPRDAQYSLLGALRDFRQGLDLGRERGAGNRPGQSFWPEGDALRRLAAERIKPSPTFDHPPHPPKDTPAAVPRAGFGLPLNIGFKDRGDMVADGRVVVDGTHDRFTSPVRLCPVACQGGQAVPVVLVLDAAVPDPLRIELDAKDTSGQPWIGVAHVRSAAGARDLIGKHLRDASPPGDAVGAWCRWLATKGFKPL